MVLFVLALTLLLMLASFRSLRVALATIGLNLLSVAAAWGLLVVVFQHHWLDALLGIRTNGAIVAWLPLFLFVILFGLSMDYHVFVLSRIREAHRAGASASDAIAIGIERTAGVVTSAAVVMVGAFGVFATLSTIDMKQLGVGLATAVLLDATIVRGVLLPAALQLLGENAWHEGRWLGACPRSATAGRPGLPAAGGAGAALSPHLGPPADCGPRVRRTFCRRNSFTTSERNDRDVHSSRELPPAAAARSGRSCAFDRPDHAHGARHAPAVRRGRHAARPAGAPSRRAHVPQATTGHRRSRR